MLRNVLVCCAALLLTGCYEQQVKLPGYVDNEVAKLATSGSGVVQKLHVSRGDTVKKGDALVSLEVTSLLQKAAFAEANFFQAQSNLKDYLKGTSSEDITQAVAELDVVTLEHALAKKTLARLQSLKTKQYVSDTAWDDAQNAEAVLRVRQVQVQSKLAKLKKPQRTEQVAALQAALQAAQASLELAQWQLSQQQICAYEDGMIDDVYFKLGEFVGPGQSVVALRASADPEVIFYVPYDYLNRVGVGSDVSVGCAVCSDLHTAIVSYVAQEPEFTPPIVYGGEFNSKYVYQVRARLQNKTALHPGQAVDVTIS